MNKSLLKEKRVHGDMMFPLEVYHMRYTNPKSTLDCHWHDEMEFLLLDEGRAGLQIETETCALMAGQAIFIGSADIHAGYPLDDAPWGFHAIVFSPSLLLGPTFDRIQSRYAEPLLKKQLIMPRHLTGDTDWERSILENMKAIITLMTTKPFTFELKVRALLFDTFAGLFANAQPQKSGREHSVHLYRTERLKKVLSYIRENCGRRIALSELAAKANMSEGHFCRFFKSMVNRTPVDYINFYKMQKAASLLEESTVKIIDAAMEVGFDNLSYFITLFKHYMNCTPSEYRKKQISG